MTTKHGHHGLKDTVDLPNGVTLGYALTGEIVSIDKNGKRTPLDNPDAVKTLWFDVSDSWPEPPRIPYDPKLDAQIRQAQAAIEANKPRAFTVTVDPEDGAVYMNLESGQRVRLPSA